MESFRPESAPDAEKEPTGVAPRRNGIPSMILPLEVRPKRRIIRPEWRRCGMTPPVKFVVLDVRQARKMIRPERHLGGMGGCWET